MTGLKVCKIHTRTLSKPSEDLASLVLLEGSVGVELVLEDPLPSDDIGPRRAGHKIPGVVLEQSIMFFHHSCSPVGIGQSATVGLRNSREWCSMVECRHPETMFGSRGHGMLIGDWGNRHGALGQRLIGWCSRNCSRAACCWSGRRRRARSSGVHLRDDAGGWCWRRGRGRQGWKP